MSSSSFTREHLTGSVSAAPDGSEPLLILARLAVLAARGVKIKNTR